jgi:hypothetical protein
VQKKAIYSLFLLAVLLFIAKPFIGFAVVAANQGQAIASNNILVKCFAKRKPEDIRDAENRKAALQALLLDPPLKQLLPITFLLGILFPVLFRSKQLITNGFLSHINFSLIPVAQPYLLTGKLII